MLLDRAKDANIRAIKTSLFHVCSSFFIPKSARLALSRGRAHLHNFKQKQKISIRFSDQLRFDLANNTLRRYE